VTNRSTVGESYFETLQVRATRGRVFTAADHAGTQPVAVINRTLAAQAWPGKDPVGRRIRTFRDDKPGPLITVIGEVADLMPSTQRATPDPVIYEPYRLDAPPSYFVAALARTRVPPAGLGRAFRDEVRKLDRDLPVQDVSTLEDLLALDRWPLRVFGTMFALFGGSALLLATVGLYAVVAYGVSRRTQEIGLRVALGASAGNILRMVFGGGMRPVAIGLGLGLAAAFGITRVLNALLVGISPTDPLTFGAVVAVLIGAATLGCAVPARRAMQVDPAIALRHE
jgi:hypothetical protein